MFRYVATLAYAFSAVALGASLDVSKINGAITIAAGRQAGDLETVNGSVSVGKGATVEDVETVNGSVRLAEQVMASSAETVNGEIEIGAGSQVRGGATTVNGAMTLGRDARVGGKLENVNGGLRLEGASVSGGIETVNGDVYLATGSRVDGGIHVEKPTGWHVGKPPKNPRITIESCAVVTGPLHFEREVDLYVGAGVNLPSVEGVAPRRFTL